MKLTVVGRFRLTEIAAWAQEHLGAGTRVVSDGLACFQPRLRPQVPQAERDRVKRPDADWLVVLCGRDQRPVPVA